MISDYSISYYQFNYLSFISTLPSQVKKNLGVQDQSTQRPKIKLHNRIKAESVLQSEKSNPPSMQVVALSNENNLQKSILSEDATAFVVTFNEPQDVNDVDPTASTITTSTGFSAVKLPKLTSAQRLKSQSISTATTTAQRVPSKSNKINNRENTTGKNQ